MKGFTQFLNETIIKKDGKYRLVSKSGKNLGEFDTRDEAEEREREIQYFKSKNEEHGAGEEGTPELLRKYKKDTPMEGFDAFSSLLTEEKNTHMTHIEDQVIYGGVNGAREAILALRSLRDMLAGNSKGSTDVTVKWDGAPAVFCGIDPEDGKFFVAKKGIFNKNPKVYKTKQDIYDDIDNAELAQKMLVSLEELSKLGIKGVVQGDIMFTDDVKEETIDGEKYLTFHPNTIVYAVPSESEAARSIRKAKIGVVFHTAYNGSSFADMRASYGVDVSKFKSVPTVWAESATLKDLSGTVTLTQKDTKEVTDALSTAGKIFSRISGSTLRELEAHPDLPRLIETYNNSFVRKGEVIKDTRNHVEGLIKFIEERYAKEIDKRKSEKGKQAQRDKLDTILEFFNRKNKPSLVQIFELQKAIVNAKMIVIKKLNKLNNINTFVKTKNGFKVTGAEGFVAIDHMKGGAVKLVDRMEFSMNNFDPDIVKGFDKVR